ncbi:hypothetical protein U27_02073 [Candidatus Vecturithrix granuli]|uniref:Uncharacterized protein n=1 Tax=Vecturithrix granuli TaxID=1499967 RepID=A0A0S6WAI8_VECG1|nr:hypothetical protein U27_02073 [Candidatus Vecturithrix granuli]
MKKYLCLLLTLGFAMIGFVGNQALFAETAEKHEYHGADSVFQAEGLAIFWAILKGADDEHSLVYIKLISTAEAGKPFQHYRVLAVNPFSKEEEWVTKGETFEEQNLLKLNRASFRNKTERRFFFYKSEEIEEDQKPDMTVYYQGIPDTAPEFLEETQIEQYFEGALIRLKKK